jgi:glycosyltransferase involved in cell wall biosynthesis
MPQASNLINVAIDASNISSGGGLTHLVKMLSSAQPMYSGVAHVHVWASASTVDKLPKSDWLVIHTPRWCNAGLLSRMLAQQIMLPSLINLAGCSVLFSLSGTLPVFCQVPMVTISQNMLPFEPDRAALFGFWSWLNLKMRLLRLSQGTSFRRAQGIIFLTQYAQKIVTTAEGGISGATALIPHGIESRFFMRPRPQRVAVNSDDRPLRLLYVSIQAPYKHHIELMEAIAELRLQERSVLLQMVGSNAGVYGKVVRRKRMQLDPKYSYLQDLGPIDFDDLHKLYNQADVFVFASSCENLPNILIEAMAAGLPIACSNRGPMPEILGDAGVYFDPESPKSISQAIAELVDDPVLRSHLAYRAFQRAQTFSWQRCARESFDFVAKVALQHS